MNEQASNRFKFDPCDGRDMSLFAGRILERFGVQRPSGALSTEELHTHGATILISERSGAASEKAYTYRVNPSDTIGRIKYTSRASTPRIDIHSDNDGESAATPDDMAHLMCILNDIPGTDVPNISAEGLQIFHRIEAAYTVLDKLERAAQDKGERALTCGKSQQSFRGKS